MVGHQSPKPCAISSSSATKPCPSTPIDQATTFVPSAVKRPLDLDGMTVMTDLHPPVMLANQSQQVEMELDLQPVRESSEEGEAEDLPWGNAPATATWAPMMEEVRSSVSIHRFLCRLTRYFYRSSAQTGVVPRRLSSTSAIQTTQPRTFPPSAPSGKRATSSSPKSSPTIIVPQVPRAALLPPTIV